jgi:carbonic anhydrase
MSGLEHLLENNRRWAETITAREPDFFPKLSGQQAPEYLWIGCSDSRVPANEIVDLLPGELFVHRNVANVVVHTDLNCLSVIQFAVEVLRVRHVMVVGHYGCGGVRAAWEGRPLGLIDNWLRHIEDAAAPHRAALEAIADDAERFDRLAEINVLAQVVHVCRTTIIQDAWRRGQPVDVHGWIYGLHDGRLRDLGLTRQGVDGLDEAHAAATARLLARG